MARCECTACGRLFRSVSAFDKHRTGQRGPGRRCMTDEEMALSHLVADAGGVFRDVSRGTYAERVKQ